jgi:hypothetical protein
VRTSSVCGVVHDRHTVEDAEQIEDSGVSSLAYNLGNHRPIARGQPVEPTAHRIGSPVRATSGRTVPQNLEHAADGGIERSDLRGCRELGWGHG